MPDSHIDTGTVFAFDPVNYVANVQPDGSLTTSLQNIPVSRTISPALLGTGARVTLFVFDDNNPVDAMLVGVQAAGSPVGVTPNTAACLIHRGNAQTLTTGVQTNLSFDSRDFDTLFNANAANAMWVIGDPTKITIRNPGIYVGWGNVEFAAGAGERTLAIFDTASNSFFGINEPPAVTNIDTANMQVSTGPRRITATTSWQLVAIQSSGGNLNINFDASNSAYFGVHQVG